MATLLLESTRVEEFEVRTEHLATQWRNDLSVLATPILFWWTELVAMNLMEPVLGSGEMTVGAGHDRIRHLAPTGLGQQVRVTAEVSSFDKGRATFDVSATDPSGVVYQGVHTRAVVSREQMLAALRRRVR